MPPLFAGPLLSGHGRLPSPLTPPGSPAPPLAPPRGTALHAHFTCTLPHNPASLTLLSGTAVLPLHHQSTTIALLRTPQRVGSPLPPAVRCPQGPRNCLGQHLALLEARVVLSLLHKRFAFRLARDPVEAGRRHPTVIPVGPVGGMPVYVTERTQ